MAIPTLEALKVLEAAVNRKPETPPEGFLTSAQWAQAWNIGMSTAQRKLKLGVEAGAVEVRKFRVLEGSSGLAKAMPHYRVIGKKK